MLDFFDRLNSADKVWKGKAAQKAATEYGKYSKQSIIRQYMGDHANDARGPLRLSSLGKPAVETACKIPAVKDELESWGLHNEDMDETTSLVFSMGDWFENWVGFQLRRLGYTIEECNPCSEDGQHMAEYHGVPGHLDFIVQDETGYRFVLEVKTMSSYYFNSFFDVKYNESGMFLHRENVGDDNRGYLTQLASYMHSTGLPGYWLALDKGSRKMAIGTPNDDECSDVLRRADRVIPIIQGIETLEDVFTHLRPPPGEPEVYKKQLTGRLKVPTALAYWHYTEAFYDMYTEKNSYGKKTMYVGEFDPREYEEAIEVAQETRFLMHHTQHSTYESAKSSYLG